jgi:hypothetical protein
VEVVLDIQTVVSSPAAPAQAPWNLATRVAFRFCVAYFGMYVLFTQMFNGLVVLPVGRIPPPGLLLRPLVSWVTAHVFHVEPLVLFSGSGDKTSDWVQAFCLLVIAAGVTIVWSVLDRRRSEYVRLHRWFRVFLRFALGSTMLGYGMSKVIPLQMPAPSLMRLLEPFGSFSPMGVLWSSIGSSRPYEVFTGFAELAGAVLLFVPRLATLGAIVCLADTIEIFTLNMTYDVPVKLFSFHLILLSLFLLAPDARRLANVFVLNRTAEPAARPYAGTRKARLALIAQLVFGAHLVAMSLIGSVTGWSRYGGGAPKSPLYGIWLVDEMTVDGQTRAPLVTDDGRWRRVVFQAPTAVSFQRMDDTFVTFRAAVDAGQRTITINMLNRANDKDGAGRFSFERPAADRLTLDGTMGGNQVRLQLRLYDEKKFVLLSRGFHWIQEYPFNR